MNEQIQKILVSGGVHGNEQTGIALVSKLENSDFLKNLDLQVQLLLANPAAIAINRRYVEEDLNRCFTMEKLNSTATTIEGKRAQEINQKYGPKGSSTAPDLCIDIHNSTANMGCSLIISNLDDFCKSLCCHLMRFDDAVRIYYMPEDQLQASFLPTISTRDVCIELGSQMHGTLRAALFSMADQLVRESLLFTEAWNQSSPKKLVSKEVSFYQQVRNLDYPRDSFGKASAMIHPLVQDQDYQALAPGDALFIDFNGNEIFYQGEETLWPVFINEQAYDEKGIAMSLTRKITETWDIFTMEQR